MTHHRLLLVPVLLAAALTMRAAAQSQPYAGHGADSIPPEAIAAYAPRPLPAQVSRRIQQMLDVRGLALGIPSPDGRRLYYTWTVTGTPAVWRLDGPRAFPVQLTGGEDPTRPVGIAPDGKWLVLSRDVGGREDPGLYLQPTEGGAPTVVQHVPRTRAFFGFVSRDSKWVYFTANDVAPDSYAVYRFEIATGTRELLVSEPGLWSIADRREGDDGVRLLLRKATGALSAEYVEWADRDRSLTPLLGQGERTDYDARYAPAPGELFVRTNRNGDFRRLYKVQQGRFTPITPDVKMDVSGFHVDEARLRVYYTLNEVGYTRARVLDARTLQPQPLPPVAGVDHVRLGPTTPDGRFVVLGFETARAPVSPSVFDWQTQALTQWGAPAAPEVDLTRFATVRLDTYPARDGTPIPMFVRYPDHCVPEAPPPAEPCPIVVNFHGGPESQAVAGFNPSAQVFVDAGFIYVTPNVRGSDGYGKRWLAADDGAKRLDVITDIEDAGRHLRARFTRDGRAPRIGVMGGSYGGYATLIAMSMFAGTYDAGVSNVGISNLVTFLRNTAPYRRALRISEYGDPETQADVLLRLSPTTYVDRIAAPVLIIHGVDDPRVPVGEAIQMHEAVRGRGVASELMILAQEGHGAVRRDARALVLGHTLLFFEKHFKGRGTGLITN
jgi:dipeptidyl aminopeptidase/acylaminoacyl peptidase